MVYSIDDNVFVVAGHVKLSLQHSDETEHFTVNLKIGLGRRDHLV